MGSTREILVYALSDPRDERVRYVAMVVDATLEHRLEQHVAGAIEATRAWCTELAELELRPTFVLLERVRAPGPRDFARAGRIMSGHIDRMRRAGEPLLEYVRRDNNRRRG